MWAVFLCATVSFHFFLMKIVDSIKKKSKFITEVFLKERLGPNDAQVADDPKWIKTKESVKNR